MNATFKSIPRALMAILGPLTALGLLLSVQGCSTAASATTSSVTGPTPASALRVYNSFVTANKVALANHNELLALSLLTGSQLSITSATYGVATAGGHLVTDPAYGQPTLYVPKLTTYPQWFMATVPEHPATGGTTQTALLVFDRPDAAATWALSGSAILDAGSPALNVAVDKVGYATALATSDQTVKLQPDVVGAIHATVADDGPSSAAAPVVQAGPHTTGLYQANKAIARQVAAQNDSYNWELEGTSYPFFALRTTDGGALVFYTMTLATTTIAAHLPHVHSKAPLPVIQVPAVFKSLVPATHKPFQHQLTVNSTFSYITLDPAATAQKAPLQVIGAGGAVTYVRGT
jgi:hypothetical protein